jgi:type IV pilus assembly protein PilN
VILINLLPHREEKRRQRKQAFFAGLGGWRRWGLAGGRHLVRVLQQMTRPAGAQRVPEGRDRARPRSRTSPRCAPRSTPEGAPEGGRRPADRPQHAGAPARRTGQADARGRLPDVASSRRQTVQVTGVAQTNERVSEFLRNTLYNSPWLERPSWSRSRPSTQRRRVRETARLFEFSMRVSIKRPGAAGRGRRARRRRGRKAREVRIMAPRVQTPTGFERPACFDQAARSSGASTPTNPANGRCCPRWRSGWPPVAVVVGSAGSLLLSGADELQAEREASPG